ncbi:hypothetical protein [Devosia sp. A16]|nr:hypothetical protein [Devosia sp. A16]
MVDLSTDRELPRVHLGLNAKGWIWIACFAFGAAVWTAVIFAALSQM